MERPQVTVSILPFNTGIKDFTVTATLDNVVIDSAIDPISIAHLGNLKYDAISDSFYLAHLGYQFSDYEYTHYWETGTGITINSDIFNFTYTQPGHYTLKLFLVVNGSEVFVYNYDIYVKDNTLNYDYDDNGLLERWLQKCYRFATETDMGFGWAEFGNESWLWADTPASFVQFFNGGDQVTICYDEKTGLPYILDNRKNDSFLKKTYKDKEDFKKSNSGFDISGNFLPEEMIASQDSFYISPSDLFVKIFGIDSEELLEGFKCDLSLFKDRESNYTSKLNNIPFDRELYFSDNNNKEGHKLRLYFELNKSKYVFERYIMYLLVTERLTALLNGLTEVEHSQLNWCNTKAWITKFDYRKERVFNSVYPAFGSYWMSYTNGPDNIENSAVVFSTVETLKLGYFNDQDIKNNCELWVWSTSEDIINNPNVDTITETKYEFDLNGTMWYFIKVSYVELEFKPASYFDFRFIPKDNIVDYDIEYIIDEVVNKKHDTLW